MECFFLLFFKKACWEGADDGKSTDSKLCIVRASTVELNNDWYATLGRTCGASTFRHSEELLASNREAAECPVS